METPPCHHSAGLAWRAALPARVCASAGGDYAFADTRDSSFLDDDDDALTGDRDSPLKRSLAL